MSDREKAGLRGPVRTCAEVIIFADGPRFSKTAEYSPDGKLLETRVDNSDGSEWVTTQLYDASGRLVKIVSGKSGEPGTTKVYAYDLAGKLQAIANTENDDRVDFSYDERGRKIAIQSFDPKSLQRNQSAAFGGSPWDAVQAGFGVPAGGRVMIIYDENDNQTEVQVQDGEGQLVSRIVRSYDEAGRIKEEKPIWENPVRLFGDRLLDDAGGQLDPEQMKALNKGLNALLSGRTPAGASYKYDAAGRVTEVRQRSFVFEKITSTTYNDQGGEAEERTTYSGNAAVPIGDVYSIDESGSLIPSKSSTPAVALDDPHLPGPSQARYVYQYDEDGNWTQRTSTISSSETSTVVERKLTYY